MFSLNTTKKFDARNHPFMLGIKGHSYQTFTEYSGRKGYQLSAIGMREDGVFTTTLRSRPSYIDGLPYYLPTTVAEKSVYFSGRIINSIFSVPYHTVRFVIDISLQILQTIAFVFEFVSAKLSSKFSIPYNPSFSFSKGIATIRNLSGCCGAINQLAERFFLIDKFTQIKSFSSVIRKILLKNIPINSSCKKNDGRS